MLSENQHNSLFGRGAVASGEKRDKKDATRAVHRRRPHTHTQSHVCDTMHAKKKKKEKRRKKNELNFRL